MEINYIRKDGKYQVLVDDILVGYIEKCTSLGWIFYKNENAEVLGGLETLKETKEWLSEYNGYDYIINKIINNK
jgi:hypothetical protein